MNKIQMMADWQQLTYDHEVNISSSVTLDYGTCYYQKWSSHGLTKPIGSDAPA